jgi:MobC-like protein
MSQCHTLSHFHPQKQAKIMKSASQIRSEVLTIRMTPDEYLQLERLAATTVNSGLSDYCRHVLLQKPVTMLRRNQSLDDFLVDMLLMRKELRQIGNQFNQAVHRLQILKGNAELRHWLFINEQDKNRLFQLIEQISTQLNEAHRLWSHV